MDPNTKEEWYFQQSPEGEQTWAGPPTWEIRPYPPQAAVAAQGEDTLVIERGGTPLFTFKEKWRHPPVRGPVPPDVGAQLTNLWTDAMQVLEEVCESWWQTVGRDMQDMIEDMRTTTGNTRPDEGAGRAGGNATVGAPARPEQYTIHSDLEGGVSPDGPERSLVADLSEDEEPRRRLEQARDQKWHEAQAGTRLANFREARQLGTEALAELNAEEKNADQEAAARAEAAGEPSPKPRNPDLVYPTQVLEELVELRKLRDPENDERIKELEAILDQFYEKELDHAKGLWWRLQKKLQRKLLQNQDVSPRLLRATRGWCDENEALAEICRELLELRGAPGEEAEARRQELDQLIEGIDTDEEEKSEELRQRLLKKYQSRRKKDTTAQGSAAVAADPEAPSQEPAAVAADPEVPSEEPAPTSSEEQETEASA